MILSDRFKQSRNDKKINVREYCRNQGRKDSGSTLKWLIRNKE